MGSPRLGEGLRVFHLSITVFRVQTNGKKTGCSYLRSPGSNLSLMLPSSALISVHGQDVLLPVGRKESMQFPSHPLLYCRMEETLLAEEEARYKLVLEMWAGSLRDSNAAVQSSCPFQTVLPHPETQIPHLKAHLHSHASRSTPSINQVPSPVFYTA